MKDGKPEGDARMVRPGLRGAGVGITRDGRLYVVEGSTITNSYTVPVDLGTGAAGKPVRTTHKFDGMNGFATWSPDGKRLAWFGLKRPAQVTGGALTLRDVVSGKERTLPVPGQAVLQDAPEWLSDNRSLTYRVNENGKPVVIRLDVETGETTRIVDGRPVWNSVLSRDGKTVYHVKNDELVAVDCQTDAERKILGLPEGSFVRTLTQSPDGKTLAYVVQHMKTENGRKTIDRWTIDLADLTTGQSRTFKTYSESRATPGFYRRGMSFTPDGRALITTDRSTTGHINLLPLDGGPEKILVQSAARLNDPSMSSDGRSLTYTEVTEKSDLWVLENFLPALAAK
jgi:Tol biopolymer transport system component